MKTKCDALKYFDDNSRLIEKYPPPAIRIADGRPISLNGVLFHDRSAYMTNGIFLSRVSISDDFPLKDQVAFYVKGGEGGEDDLLYLTLDQFKRIKGARHGLFGVRDFKLIDGVIDNCAEHQFFIRRADLMDAIGDFSLKIMPTCTATFALRSRDIELNINDPRGRVDTSFFFSRHLLPGARNTSTVSGATFCVNLSYLFEIGLFAFSHCDILGIKFDESPTEPVVFFNNGRSHPQISWAVMQANKRTKIV